MALLLGGGTAIGALQEPSERDVVPEHLSRERYSLLGDGARGPPSGRLGPWTDLYALRGVLWRIVAGGNLPWDDLRWSGLN